ncbi:MAG: maleylpyruvate isomerase N-terminal domain-containing protein [Actinomycetota bacterium]
MTIVARIEAIELLERGHRRVAEQIDGIDTVDLERPATIGGGDWSAKDLVGHLAAWEREALRALERWRLGRRPHIEDVFADGAPAVDRLNAETAARTSALPLDAVLIDAEQTHAALIEAMRRLDDDAWIERAPYETRGREAPTLAEMLGGITGAPGANFDHASAHLASLEAFRASVRPGD